MFFEFPKQIKTSAAAAPCAGGGLSRGYRARQDGTGAETFAAGAPHETRRPTRWPVGVRGAVFKTTVQAFLRHCRRLHDDLLGVLEVALDLPDDALAARWARQHGELRLGCHPARLAGTKPWSPQVAGEDADADEDEKDRGRALLTLVFRETEHDEVVLFRGPALHKWLPERSRRGSRYDYDAADDNDSESIRCNAYGPPFSPRYSISFVGHEDVATAS